jgi:hypothetical protein
MNRLLDDVRTWFGLPHAATALLEADREALGLRRYEYLLHQAQRRAMLPANGGFHILCHTFCSHLAMQGATPKAIQELAGHQDLSTTQRYMHVSPAHKDAAIRLLDRRPTEDEPKIGVGESCYAASRSRANGRRKDGEDGEAVASRLDSRSRRGRCRPTRCCRVLCNACAVGCGLGARRSGGM